jgi:glucose-6-phosphate dehydrogenase assembly protein OpcA
MKLMHFAVGAALLAGTTAVSAQDAPRAFTQGPVWTFNLVEVKPGMGEAYLNYLSKGWKASRLAAQKAGYETAYKIIRIDDARDGEANLLLMIQYKNYAAFDTTAEQMDEITKAVEAQMGKTPSLEDRQKMRTNRGERTGREIIFKN